MITAAAPATVTGFLEALDSGPRSLAQSPRRMPVSDPRRVDVCHNLGRVPGERLDGIDLVATMLAPA